MSPLYVQFLVFTGSLIAYIVGAAVGVLFVRRLGAVFGGGLICVLAYAYDWAKAPIPASETWSVIVLPSLVALVVGMVLTWLVSEWLVSKPPPA